MTRARSVLLVAFMLLGSIGCGRNLTRPAETQALGGAPGTPANATGGGDCAGLPTAPKSDRVDLYTPSFSNPTRVINPLFPIARLDRVLMLGNSDGEALRVETTLLARTKTFRLNGRRVEALVSQYVSWADRRIHEVAFDWYAQDDHGAVWYLGEDVFNYEDGRIANTDGTWQAGRNVPAAMIMPPNPQIGDAWRPEDLCGLVFEEVVATAAGITVQGPRGPISGALKVRELHMDGTFEDKTFAPGYGEFSTGSGGNLEAVALAVPTDAVPGPVPAELRALSKGSAEVFRAAKARQWSRMSATLEAMTEAWEKFQRRGVPSMLNERMSAALDDLEESVQARNAAKSRQASIDVGLTTLDLELRYRSRAQIDLALIEVWARQLIVDSEARDRSAVRGDIATIQVIRQRLAGHCRGDIDSRIGDLETISQAPELDSATDRAERLQASLARYTDDDGDLNRLR